MRIDTGQQGDKYRNHAQVWELLPWYINGSLPAEEQQRVSGHVTVCLICRKELGLQYALRDSVRNHELDELMVSASFDRLSAKLREQDTDAPIALPDSRPGPWQRVGQLAQALKLRMQRPLRPAYIVTVAAVLAVAVLLSQFTAEPLPGNNTFTTLSTRPDEAPAADLRLIFADGVSAAERNAILNEAGLRLVAGPDERGLYFVNADNVSPDALAATLEQLRGDANILFAELGSGAAPDNRPPGER